MLRGFLSLLCLLILPSCASVDVAKFRDAKPKSEDCTLEVYTNISEVKKPYELLCTIASSTGSTHFADKSLKHAIDLALPDACSCGGDAIVLNQTGTEGLSLYNGYGRSSAAITVIRYTAN